MADNILGFLLVTSSSRGRNVMRFPPDPLSPIARLSQPIYSSGTFTNTDTIWPSQRGQKATRIHGEHDGLSSAFTHKSLSTSSVRGRLGVTSGDEGMGTGTSLSVGVSDRGSLRTRGSHHGRPGMPKKAVSSQNQDSDESDTSESEGSSDTDDSELDVYNWMSAAHDPRRSRTANGNEIRLGSTSLTGERVVPGSLGATRRNSRDRDVDGNYTGDDSRRGSVTGTLDSLRMTGDRDQDDKENTKRDDGVDKFIESQYQYSLGYPLDFLSDMLTPPKSACNRKFEINVDELIFVGHPVTCGLDGRWTYPELEEDSDVRPTARGRRARDLPGPSHLGTVIENESSPDSNGTTGPPNTNRNGTTGTGTGTSGPERRSSTSRSRSDDGPPELNMFHLVVILDKPDPQIGTQFEGSAAIDPVDEVYREIAFKWAAAAFDLQVRENYIAKQAYAISRMKDKCQNENISITECNRICYERYSLDRLLNKLYTSIYDFQRRPVNPLYAHLPTTINMEIEDLSFSMVLSPKSTKADEDWAHWGELEEAASESDESDDDDWNDPFSGTKGAGGKGAKAIELDVQPWQTLLLLDDNAGEKAREISELLVGLGVLSGDVTATPGSVGLSSSATPTPQISSRRDSKDTSVEDDEGALMKCLIEACDVTKPLPDIAHILRFDLEGIVIPLARELVQNKKAILIDVINNRLRTIVMPTTITEHDSSLQEYSTRFARQFPDLPHLATFISRISATPTHYRNIMSSQQQNSSEWRQKYMDALIWLIRQDLLIQIHTRARIYATAEVKKQAWIKLWQRRRGKWLAAKERRSSHSTSTAERERPVLEGSRRSSAGSQGAASLLSPITPKAVNGKLNINPMDSIAIPTVPPPKMDQSYMDYDPDLEMDSDYAEGESSPTYSDMHFSENVAEPDDIPDFKGSFIFKPGRAQKDEARWLRVIRERGVKVSEGGRRDEIWASKFDLCVQYFDGVATFEEISYRTGLPKREIDRLLELYKEDVITILHP